MNTDVDSQSFWELKCSHTAEELFSEPARRWEAPWFRSLLQDAAWSKMTKGEVHAQMCGYLPARHSDNLMLPEGGRKYGKRYFMNKAIQEPERSRGLKTFSNNMPGLYFGFEQTTLEGPAMVSESNKHATADISMQEAKADALVSAKKSVSGQGGSGDESHIGRIRCALGLH